MDESAFQKGYARLNTAQKEAVDTTEGPVMVIAGPGTGKTQILTLRIANILKTTQVGPENILALTFTESGARAMRERLASYIGAPAYRVPIYTFHEFAGILIRTYPEAYTRAIGGNPISDLEKILLIETILDTPTIKALRPNGNPEFYIKPILSALSTLKREYITPDKFVAIIEEQEKILETTPKIHEKGAHKGKVRGEYIEREKSVLKNRELLFVYRAYEAALQEKGQFDFDDMIFETVVALQNNEDMLRSLQEQYQYILADEHQDVNGSQNKILELLASFHDRPNIFVVGDEKQSIYRFQGASLENFLYFEEKFPHTKTIALTENYRSVQEVLDISHELIKLEDGPAAALRVPLVAVRKEKAVIERRHFSHEAVEHAFLVEKVKALLADRIEASEIAIIARTNREVEEIAGVLRMQGIPTFVSADGDILNHPITTHVRTLLRAVLEPHNERPLFELLQSSYMGIDLHDLLKLLSSRSFDRPLVRMISDPELLQTLGIKNIEPILRVAQMLAATRERMEVEAPQRVLAHILNQSGFLHHAVAIDPHEGGRVLRRLYDEVEEMVREHDVCTLRDIEVMFTKRVTHNLPLTAPYIRTQKQAVSVLTAHKAKGLEYLHVFLPHLTDSRWGGKTRTEYFKIPITEHLNADDFSADDDERKLLYVALTRAKVGLYISESETSTEGRLLLPTRLLEEVPKDLIAEVETTDFESRFEVTDGMKQDTNSIQVDSELLTQILRDRGLSATALNNYLRDPWNYFYRNVVRIPEVQPESAQFGTALHDTLRSITKHRREKGKLPTVSEMKVYLERELGKMPLSHNEYTRLHERGLVALTQYIAYTENALPVETKEEYKIQVFLETGNPILPEVLLTGMLDRLDFDAEGRLLRVVDYKSGKPKTRGYIEGTTKDSSGDYKRQLTFYALLLSLQDNELLRTREGLLSFVEADEKGKIHEEAYTITEAEIANLKQEIIRVVNEITTGAFLKAVCDPEKCDYCDLVMELYRREV